MFLDEEYNKVQVLKKSQKGTVWLVTDKDGDIFVIKEILRTGLPLKLLKEHPSGFYPRIIYLAEDNARNLTIVVEEYINGKSLADKLQHRDLKIDALPDLLLKFCYGLKEIHTLGLVHRDIKPSNIIIRDDGSPVLIDFDAARLNRSMDKTSDTVLLGTKGYAPPEQFGYAATDKRSDIYALGITFEEFLGDDYKGYLRKILKKCHALDPDLRYQNVDDILKAIKRYKWQKPIIMLLLAIVLLVCLAFGISLQNTLPQEEPLQKNVPQVKEATPEATPSTDSSTSDTTTQQPDNTAATFYGVDESTLSPMQREFLHKYQLQPGHFNFIEMEISINGNVAYSKNIHKNIYKNWEKTSLDNYPGYGVIFPAGWYIDVVITNCSLTKTWDNPQIKITYDSGDIKETETRSLSPLPPGEKTILHYNLAGHKTGVGMYPMLVDVWFHHNVPEAPNISQPMKGESIRINFYRD
ncbi:MAG: serine/threonine protein kinase [Anaerovibrio sp.]|nr:serine/threonine protein kinase [Anaerovibrio sp.]